jgi:CubicO group peptidase (beta-lactamase class C family)
MSIILSGGRAWSRLCVFSSASMRACRPVLVAGFVANCAFDPAGASASAASASAASASAGTDGVDQRCLDRGLLRSDLEAVRASGDIVGLSAEVRCDGGRERARVGSNELHAQTPLPWGAQFRVASVTKTFTAVVVLQLVQEGKLSLSDSVERWLPGVVAGHGNDGSTISVEQLLRHQSGLSNYLEAPEVAALVDSASAFEAHRFDAISQAELVALAMKVEPLFAPGEGFAYSNTNYLLLGMIIEAVTGATWREQVEHRIIAALGLSGTSVPGYNPFFAGPHVRGYAEFPDRGELFEVTATSLISSADAGVVSTLGDLNHFFQSLVRGELLAPEVLGAMQDTLPIDHPAFPGSGYGLGLVWSPLSCGGGYWHHPGDTFGYWVWTGVSADGERSVALVMNSPPQSADAYAAATALVDRALCATAASGPAD